MAAGSRPDDSGDVTLALPLPSGSTPRVRRVWIRPAVALALVVVAYRTSLVTLLETMQLDTPLAHLSLVPIISLVLALLQRKSSAGPEIHDRQLDWIIGLPLIGAALVINVVLPARLSAEFWVWRVDLLSLPLFVAGLLALLFGTRTLWKYRLAVLFLFLAWPYPYALVLDRWLGEFTQLTVAALSFMLGSIPLAQRVAGSDSLFQVTYGGEQIQMSVASACSGANGLVGFLLVGLAFTMVVRGGRARKIAWLATGAVLVWTFNLARILMIFWSAGRWGEEVAIEGFHPYVGLVVFNVAIVVMMLLMRVFGLEFTSRHASAGGPPLAAVVGDAMPPPPPPPLPAWSRRRATAAVLTVLAATATVGVYNGELREYDRVASGLGAPRLASFATSQERPEGWNLTSVTTYDWSRRFFGSDSLWTRYSYSVSGGTEPGTTPLWANTSITADVIETSNRASLSAYGVESCYTFHGHEITGRRSVDLGSGVTGGILTWTSSKTDTTWTTLYWHWPINTPDGTRYERITLVMQDAETNKFQAPTIETDTARELQLDLNDALRDAGTPEARARLLSAREFLVGFAREMIERRTPAPDAT